MIFLFTVTFVLFLAVSLYPNNVFNIEYIIVCIIISICFGLFVVTYTLLLMEASQNGIKRKILEYEAINLQEEVNNDIFENSIKMSYKYLDQYYLQTREHAQRGFMITVCVSLFGAILLGIGIVAMFFGNIKPSHISCASGVITEFIAAIFFYLYNRTISSMSKYHDKLVLSQNISIALKVSETLSDTERNETKKLIVSELLKNINENLIQADNIKNNR